MQQLILNLVAWCSAHPQLAGLLVAAVAFFEALAFVGMLVPGAIMMLGAGALVGVGALGFWSTLAWAVGGAVAGDGVSYWLGHRYRGHFGRLPYVRTHPQLLERGEAFFERHGGKSVLLARFIGPVRPVLPVVAGMLGMAPWRFYLYNILSALAWAPAHLIPGMAFGASLALAGQVAGRLALVLGLMVVFVWLVVWGVRAAYARLEPHASVWSTALARWGKSHRWFAWLVGDLMDPARPVSRPLLLWLALLIGGIWLFFGVLEDVLSLDPLVYAGHSFYQILQQLRNPVADRLMTAITEMGDAAVAIPVAAVVLGWLLWWRAWRDAAFWLAAVAFGVLAVATIKFALHVPRPINIYSGADAFSFPSGHATLTTVIYGYLAVLSAHAMVPRRRWIPYACALILIAGVAFSRLYLGAHWLADVTAGIALGVASVALLAIARARHPGAHRPTPWLPQIALLAFAGAATWHIPGRMPSDLERYAVRSTPRQVALDQWWATQWRTLPSYRMDVEGDVEQPLNLQWAGDLHALRTRLVADGWREPLALSARSALHWLLPHPPLDDLPVVPQLHNGHYPALVLTGPAAQGGGDDRRVLLRVWPSGAVTQDGNAVIWVGAVSWERVERLPLVSFPRNAAGYDAALQRLQAALHGIRLKRVKRRGAASNEEVRWSGDTLLGAAPPHQISRPLSGAPHEPQANSVPRP